MVGVPMEVTTSLTLNGVGGPADTLMLGRGRGPSDLVELRANLFALVVFGSPMRGRGWPEVEDATRIVRPDGQSLRELQGTLRDVLQFASTSASELAMPGVAHGLEQSLVAAMDRALSDCEPAISAKFAAVRGNYLKLVRRLDEILSQDLGAAFYSDELARRLGVSARTLHNALVGIRGRSLHDYIRLRRLWNVHQALLGGSPPQIKAIALANGFWHPGEFSVCYREMFGETPSQTRYRANPRRPTIDA
jgi:AraC family ethanolamine operon transcriptional activator